MANTHSEHLEVPTAEFVAQSLPPLPASATELIQLLADENTPTVKLVKLIEEDVALASRLVGLANSAFYAVPKPVTSVQDAVLRVLGLDVARGVVLSAVAGATLDYRSCRGFQVERFWRESLLVGSLTRSLCLSSTGSLGDHAPTGYLTGLLLRLGLLGLAALRPEDTAAALSDNEEKPLRERLQERLGLDHCLVGAAIARHWLLPEPIPTVLEQRESANSSSLAGLLGSTVVLAANMATHEIYVSSRSVPTAAPTGEDWVSAGAGLATAVESVQSECSRLHQQAQTIAATI